jgi:hypothetical protein
MPYTDQQKALFVLKFAEEGYEYAKFVTRVKRDSRRANPRVPDVNTIKNWLEAFSSTGSVHGERGKNKPK